MSEYPPPSSGLPDPLLYSLTSAASLIYLTFWQSRERTTKRKKTGKGATSPPKMLARVYEAKVPAQLLRAVSWAWCFRMGWKALLCFFCYLSLQLSYAKSKSSPGCCTAAHCGWLPGRESSAGGAELPGMPAASCPCLLLSAPQPAGEWSMETPQLRGCSMQGYGRDSEMGSQLGECWGTEQELWKNGKLYPLPNKQKLVMDWEIITEEYTRNRLLLQIANNVFKIKCQTSVFLLSPPHFCSSKIFRSGCASIMAAIKLRFTSTSLKLTSCETVTQETGQIRLYGAWFGLKTILFQLRKVEPMEILCQNI